MALASVVGGFSRTTSLPMTRSSRFLVALDAEPQKNPSPRSGAEADRKGVTAQSGPSFDEGSAKMVGFYAILGIALVVGSNIPSFG